VAAAPANAAPAGDGQTSARRSSSAGGRSERRRSVPETMTPGRSWVGALRLPKQEGGGDASSAATCAVASGFGWGSNTATSDPEWRVMVSWHRERRAGGGVRPGASDRRDSTLRTKERLRTALSVRRLYGVARGARWRWGSDTWAPVWKAETDRWDPAVGYF
jgi:hypothetical protein